MSDTNTAAPMRLRAEPPRVTRLSRKVLAGVGAAALLGVGGALIYALQTREAGPGGGELYSTENRPTADGLAGLPRDYTGPILGPALPGDLGRPILDAQNRGQPIVPPAITTPAVDPEEQRRLAEEEAARLSNVFFQSGPRTGGPAGTAMPGLAGLTGQPDGTAGQNRHTAFLNGPVDRQTVAPDRVAPPASPYILQAGAVIPAALITGIRSDLPGQITAQVTENVYDSPTGSLLLIPQGTRIIGQYDDGVTFGQRRVLLVWNRLILPGGRSIVLERLPGADASGYAGLEDGIDYHWWDLMKAAGLSTLLAVGAELATSDEDRLIRAIRDGAQDTVNQAGQQIVQRQLQVAPTLTIRPGFPVRIIVTRDLVFEPAGG
ncbi:MULTISPECIES: TrbI/VirB10 family protein [Alphaproteobacteria]|jgi:type IV secretion system protein VirB10|uniref:TrbI/VirB10 family protein n=6 Tax=Paracoccus TaxID=265 RepID=A0A5C6S5U7_9RHOB|nr:MULTISPECIES: TrbI/VirB10 family protein [Alphaproteobacteria]MCV0383109.1 TrbI/VirB10 family protein [Erythrobacter sp.]ARC35567.1 conjugal transfer protein TraI [Paracoccus yeei]AZY93356.1 TrbI/VirB10 family protein [Paracoccus sp. Arc7-R13]MBO6763701.1 TrbI/VirB10 family protein [Maricaulis sp.]MDP5305615.1 TrbI/VirB10 family protein [Paracoccus sp. 2205BS29-5]